MKNFIKKGTNGTIVKTPRIIYCLEKMMSFSVDSFMKRKSALTDWPMQHKLPRLMQRSPKTNLILDEKDTL